MASLHNTYLAGQRGQSLIETMVGLVVLVMGVTAAVGLANYALNASTNVTKQLIAMGLAREGLEAVKNMRDTNWLNDALEDSCYDFRTGQNTASCYKRWDKLNGWYDLKTNVNDKTFTLEFDPLNTVYWKLVKKNNQFQLLYDSAGTNGFYTVSSGQPSDYYRMITITEDTTEPFNHPSDLGARLVVLSQVWWSDKNCPTPSADSFPTSGSCRIQLQTFLTNWKNY
jgi:type II secretory pathway pseudopilin PulG